MRTVKAIRIIVLLVLAVLLPARGVMATTMACMPMTGGESTSHSHAGHVMHGDHASAVHAGHADHGDHGQRASNHADSGCNMCSACCSVSSLPAAWPRLPEATLIGDVSFAEPHVRAAIFESSGLERPPRSI